MDPSQDMTPAMRELEAALRSVAPNAAGVNRDELSFQLGQAAARRTLRVWQGSTGMLALVISGMLIVPSLGGRNRPIMERPIAMDAPPPAPVASREEPPTPEVSNEAIRMIHATETDAAARMRELLLRSPYIAERERTTRLGAQALVAPRAEGYEDSGAPGHGRRTESETQTPLELFLAAFKHGRSL